MNCDRKRTEKLMFLSTNLFGYEKERGATFVLYVYTPEFG
jgi:hypothetical protein